MRGDYPSSREKREALAAAARRGASSAGFKFHQGAGAGNIGFEVEQSPTCTADWHNPGVCTQYGEEVAGTLTARHDSSPCPDRGQNVICMADDNAKAAIDEDMCGSLKVGGAPPMAAYDEAVSR